MATTTDMMVYELETEKWDGWREGAEYAHERCHQARALCTLLQSRAESDDHDIDRHDFGALLTVLCHNLGQLEDDCRETVNFLNAFHPQEG